eukprot:scaffold5038_cov112-Isochrysis_galbana.AAC.7
MRLSRWSGNRTGGARRSRNGTGCGTCGSQIRRGRRGVGRCRRHAPQPGTISGFICGYARWHVACIYDEPPASIRTCAVVPALLRGGDKVPSSPGQISPRSDGPWLAQGPGRPALLARGRLPDAGKGAEVGDAGVAEQKGQRDDAVEPVGRALVQAAVGRATDPDRVHHIGPELGQVPAEALGLQHELTQQPALWCDGADGQRREGARFEYGRRRGGARGWLVAG